MRRRACTPALLAAAALVAGCSSEVSGSASPAGPPTLSDQERHDAFCTDVPALLRDITAQLEDVQADPASAVGVLDDAVGRMEEVQPPDDAADEWERLVAVWRELRDLVEQVDPSDPGANQELAGDLVDLQSELVDAGAAVDEWGQANC
ncbi:MULTISPECIES: hypothetical protein [unclassified Blastococcus]